MLCVSFSSKSKATNVSPKHTNVFSKKLSCHVIVNNYLCNVLCKFLIKTESTQRRKIEEQTPQLTLLTCTVVGPSEAATGGVL